MKTPIKKIVWAVDALEQPGLQQNTYFLLGALARETGAEIFPVHILTFPYQEAALALAEKRLKSLSEDADIAQIRPGKIFIDRTNLRRNAVALVHEYALDKQADVIVAATHSRGALSRLFLGSFAETLLLQSEIPVITVNPGTQVRERISNVLFPTTFDKKFRAGFQRTVQLCAALDARLTVYYKEPFIPMMEVSQELVDVLAEMDRDRKAEAKLWQDWAQRQHVPMETRMDIVPGDVAKEIEAYARSHNMDLIVMVSETTDLDAPRVGSLCRKVVRQAHCPVWTMKTDDFEAVDFSL